MAFLNSFILRRRLAFFGLVLAFIVLYCATACQSAPATSVTIAAAPTATGTVTTTPTLAPSSTATTTPLPSSTATPTLEPLRLLLSLQPPQVQQGHTVAFVIQANRPVSATGAFLDRPLQFIPGSGGTWALAGVPVNLPPGAYPVPLSIVDSLGAVIATTTTLTVTDADFGTEVVIIPESRVDLMSASVLAQEAARLAPIYGTFSAKPLWQSTFIWPHQGEITTPFGMHRTYNDGRQGDHAAFDLNGNVGDPVVAAAGGQVALAEALQTHGNTVIIDHGLGVLTAYCHLDSIAVRVGQQVAQGQELGKLGNTGLSTGPHLHWEMRIGGIQVNPLEWIERAFPSSGE